MICHFRTHRECPCEPGTCQQQPTTPAPVIQASTTTIIATAIMLGAIAAFFAFVSIPRAADAYHRNALDQQENVSHG
jgi:hypothetical protein